MESSEAPLRFGGRRWPLVVPWRVVDSNGNTHIAKVQVYCAYAEVLLGEANDTSPVK